MSSEVGAETSGEPGVTLGELAAEAGLSPLELVSAMVEAGLVTPSAYAESLGLGRSPGGVFQVTATEAEVRAWLLERRVAAGRE